MYCFKSNTRAIVSNIPNIMYISPISVEFSNLKLFLTFLRCEKQVLLLTMDYDNNIPLLSIVIYFYFKA